MIVRVRVRVGVSKPAAFRVNACFSKGAGLLYFMFPEMVSRAKYFVPVRGGLGLWGFGQTGEFDGGDGGILTNTENLEGGKEFDLQHV